MRNIHLATILLLSILILSLFPSIITVMAENDETEPSEINMYVDGDIPTVQTSNWTNISLILVDRCGIDWEHIKNSLSAKLWPLWNRNYYKYHWRRYLGYTSLKLEPEIIKGNPQGWHLKFNRSTITNTTTSFTHRVQLQAMVDDTAVDYSVIVGIKCTRFDVFGGVSGVS
ncbi:MAG TPA: hypothetical protein ENI44_05345, partial [Thermoplasmatales archaeon]|nr:hypothetical protein [Thermoplasmatales archaeon]